MTELAQAFRAVVSGRVQGVGFRWATAREAEQIGVAGWVCNLPDGNVAAHVQGRPDGLRHMKEFLERGPRGARVDGLKLTEVSARAGIHDFSIRHEPPGSDDA